MELKFINEQGQAGEAVSVSDGLFGRDYNEALVHQLVVAYQANARAGNSSQLTRSEVRHSTKKPWKQKGTGRARIGTTASPLWRSGGRAFPNSPDENFSHKVNRKMYRAGIAAILSQLAREDRLTVVENFTVEAPKTRLVVQKLKSLGVESALLVTDDLNDNLMLASRNLPNVLVLEPKQADPLSLIRFPRVVMTRGAIAKLEELLG
ncbi:MAG: 50S ribosomal protein L4 [Gammaproteobacteria bacterium]|nr:50S ribosomal protein L4 [Rhodocyclaceae bacterium]MBU3910659.1 50S ribosomal protein L4 [Gammaproteobacteria bacterium]MBU3999550.1 50S ribosomal protein L4 [Gammaproteobacteria bacterium]MBU4020733.1 50S ribosomal protein L4 [Gammaproteobacteria bacterium]MBU4095809.1 50S ribosomal protein L4 [Gammaproteobacteria bacterium]